MIGGGGSVYWGRRKEDDGDGDAKGIAVLFTWTSIHELQLSNFVDFYSSLGWNSLVSRADFLAAFHPDLAASLACFLLGELVEELKIRPSPVVFVAFSGGPKACMYKVFQILQGICETRLTPAECQLVRSCIAGHIYDSGPLDLASHFNAQFAVHSTIQKMSGPLKVVSWVAKGIASTLDGLYLTSFESQCVEYWRALYSSVECEAPYLLLFSENDDLAPHQVICRFAQHLQDFGGDVKVVKWNSSPHIGHYNHYPIQYRAAVSNMLEKASSVYSHKIIQLGERAAMHDEISELICNLQEAAVNSNQSLRRVAQGPGDHFFLPSSAEYQSSSESTSLHSEQKERPICLLTQQPSINANSVLGQVLFDVCVPKNVEGWDVRFGGSTTTGARRRSPLCVLKQKFRSRL